jgi:hypothetical protein
MNTNKRFQELRKGDKLYVFVQDNIGVETVIETGWRDIPELSVSLMPGKTRRIFYIITNRREHSMYYGEQTGTVYHAYCFGSKFNSYLMATSLQDLENYIVKRKQDELEQQKQYNKAARERIKSYENQLENFKIALKAYEKLY